MAKRSHANSRALREQIDIALEPPRSVCYADCALGTPFRLRVVNRYKETLGLTVRLRDEAGLLVPYEKECSVPFESAVELTAEGVFSPAFLAACEKCRVTAEAVVLSEEKELCRGSVELDVLPFDEWEGLSGNAERLALYVRPRLFEVGRILEDAGKRLQKWGISTQFDGYAGADKNTVRQIAAAIYASLRAHGLEREDCDLSGPVSVRTDGILKEKRANPLSVALLAAACFEAAHLHPVIALGKGVGVGVWLYDSCFLDTVTDDCEIVSQYLSEGINNLSLFDVEDLFAGNFAFTPSEKHFREKLAYGAYEYFADIRRCRLAGLPVLPIRSKSARGVELVKEEEMSDEHAPAPLKQFPKAALDGKLPRNKLWETRLLDFSPKNALINFTGKNALRLRCADVDALFSTMSSGELRLRSLDGETPPFGAELPSAEKELSLLELSKGLLKVYADETVLNETARFLYKKNREAAEESGARVLYLALGLLRYPAREDGSVRRAPLVLAPVELRRARGNEDYAVVGGEEFFVNSTLLEWLKREYNVDVRGLDGALSSLKIGEILSMVLAETAGIKGFGVERDAYLAVFSFQRYLLWNDLHSRFAKFGQNPLVAAFLKGRADRSLRAECAAEDEADPAATLIPLPADSSQYEAIALSRTGASFVLHGPPGTGKSQTITNIIANALEDGKRVLFVAEKRAALDVVKKRLDGIGIGDFCLELHGGKTDKADVLRRLEHTLSLREEAPAGGFHRCAEEIRLLHGELYAQIRALHKKRRLGISVYQALLLYLKNKDAPDVMDIESAFYDTLNERKLAECKRSILAAAAAAKECGGVFDSPFENVNLTEYSPELKDRLYCASEVLIAEIRHLRTFLGLFLEFYRQRITSVTHKKLENLCAIARSLLGGSCGKYFSGVTEEQLYTFYNANRRLDDRLEFYYRHFKVLVPADGAELARALGSGEHWRRSKAAVAAAKRLSRAALHPLTDEDTQKFLRVLCEIGEAEAQIRSVPLSKSFVDRNGEIVYKKRAEYLGGLYALHALAAETFLEYNPDAFNGMCVRAAGGYTRPVLEGYLKAAEAFFFAENSFLTLTNARREELKEDVLDYFAAKAGALIDNVDMLSNWCMYRSTAARLDELGCHFVVGALESGRLSGEDVLAGFEKNVYKNFLEINISADAELSHMTVGSLEDTIEKFRLAWEEFSRITREKIGFDLVSRLPAEDGEGSLSVELAHFRHLAKSGLRGAGLRALFAEVPELLSRAAPCFLMSPATVAQYLEAEPALFDLVIFDEASQMTTAEAIGSIARAKAAIVVGDPRQLPPTSFFRSVHLDGEDFEGEDLESVLDDCLAIGMPERHLIWHYRSKHESLIAFSNSTYYDNRLCTFPSPDGLESKVRFRLIDGCYDRGFTKCNKKEAEALVAEVVRRLSDPCLCRSSMGVVTFSSAQQSLVERLLLARLAEKGLESAAYEREEPLFVKNLENVQGDERDVILFSVCYGPDGGGRVSLNFGPLNQTGGWRRLNVALSRAREEMVVFSSMTAAMIDLSKTSSKGVAGLKAFLDYAERGRTTLAVRASAVTEGAGIGRYFARELEGYGYECRVDVGASDFKVDVAVLDPRDKLRFLLAVMFDSTDRFSVKDRNVLQVQTLKRGNWNVVRVNCVNFYNNPKREVKRVKDLLDKLTGTERKVGGALRGAKPYRAVKEEGAEVAAFVTCGENDGAIASRIKEIVSVEEPISRAFLKTRSLATFGIRKSGARIERKLDELIDGCALRRERVEGTDYFYKTDRAVRIGKFRTEGEEPLRRTEDDFTPFEMVSFFCAVLEERVSLYLDELTALTGATFKVRVTERFAAFLRGCVDYGESKGILLRSVSDRVTLQ